MLINDSYAGAHECSGICFHEAQEIDDPALEVKNILHTCSEAQKLQRLPITITGVVIGGARFHQTLYVFWRTDDNVQSRLKSTDDLLQRLIKNTPKSQQHKKKAIGGIDPERNPNPVEFLGVHTEKPLEDDNEQLVSDMKIFVGPLTAASVKGKKMVARIRFGSRFRFADTKNIYHTAEE